MSYYTPSAAGSDGLPVMPVTPTGPPPPIDRAYSSGQASSYYTPPSPNSYMTPGAPAYPQIPPSTPAAQPSVVPQMPSFPMAQHATLNGSLPQTQPHISLRYAFVPTNEEDKHSLDQRLPVPRYVRESDFIEKESQQRIFSITTDHKRKETRVRNAVGTEVALFTWSTILSTRIKVPSQIEMKCRDWMPTHTSPHLARARLIRHNLRPYIWISRGDVDIIEAPSRPGVPLAVIGRDNYNRVEMEVFHEALVGDADLLQAFVLSTIYMRVGE